MDYGPVNYQEIIDFHFRFLKVHISIPLEILKRQILEVVFMI